MTQQHPRCPSCRWTLSIEPTITTISTRRAHTAVEHAWVARCWNPACARTVVHAKELAWTCTGCGASTGRYDNGEACEACVMTSFAEAG